MEKMKSKKELRIDFIPRTKEEEKHLARLFWLSGMKRKGDWRKVAVITGIGYYVAQRSFVRVYSRHHLVVVDTLERVIKERLNELNKETSK